MFIEMDLFQNSLLSVLNITHQPRLSRIACVCQGSIVVTLNRCQVYNCTVQYRTLDGTKASGLGWTLWTVRRNGAQKYNRHRVQTLSTQMLPTNEVKLIRPQAGSILWRWRFFFGQRAAAVFRATTEKCYERRAKNESSEVFDIIKPGRRFKIKGHKQ